IGTRIQELVLLCFHYRPITSKYGALIMTTVRLMAIATLAGLGWLIVGMALREKSRLPTPPDRQPSSPPTTHHAPRPPEPESAARLGFSAAMVFTTDREPSPARSSNDGRKPPEPESAALCSNLPRSEAPSGIGTRGPNPQPR